MIVAGMCSITTRKKYLEEAVKRILPQVDVLHLCLNGYTIMPKWTRNHPKLVPVLSPENTLTSASKLMWVNSVTNCYYVSLDDDIIYPIDYVSYMVDKIDKYKRASVVTVHGGRIVDKKRNWPSCLRWHHFAKPLERDELVDIAGAGTCAFFVHSQKLSLKAFKGTPMTDLRFAYAVRSWGMDLIAVSREARWLRADDRLSGYESVWKEAIGNMEIIAERTNYLRKHLI
jgi:hypothetical protein